MQIRSENGHGGEKRRGEMAVFSWRWNSIEKDLGARGAWFLWGAVSC